MEFFWKLCIRFYVTPLMRTFFGLLKHALENSTLVYKLSIPTLWHNSIMKSRNKRTWAWGIDNPLSIYCCGGGLFWKWKQNVWLSLHKHSYWNPSPVFLKFIQSLLACWPWNPMVCSYKAILCTSYQSYWINREACIKNGRTLKLGHDLQNRFVRYGYCVANNYF